MTNRSPAIEPLPPYREGLEGRWTREDAIHLLWRTQFGASAEEIDRCVKEGLSTTLDRLLSPQLETSEFHDSERLLRQIAQDTGSIDSLKAWWLFRMLNSSNSLLEKMCLLWHNHFATSYAKVQSVGKMADQNDLIRAHALGSFRKLLHGMARDVAMLVWLDGNANRKRHANENFAREVMELFSLGVGHYTERDISEAARAFTGWHVRDGRFWLNRIQHDDGDKQVLGSTGNFDGDDVIEICLAQSACPRFLAFKLLRMFVVHHPEESAIAQVADCIRQSDFDMAQVLRKLLSSELFFSQKVRRNMIKGPLDLVLGAHRALGTRANLDRTVRLVAELGQDVFEPPTVKGWEGGRQWVNSAILLKRTNFASEMVWSDRLGVMPDPAKVAAEIGKRSIKQGTERFTELLLGKVEADVSKRLFDHAQQADGDKNDKLRSVIALIMSLPEYQLM